MASKPLKPFFARVGGKSKTCHAIAQYIPDHDTYVEPFIGGGSVFLAKPKSTVEVINDVDTDIYDMWNDLPHVRPIDFAEVMNRGTSEEHRAKFNEYMTNSPSDPHERFLRNIYISVNTYCCNRRSYVRHMGARQYKCMKLGRLAEYQDRTKDVVKHNEDWKTVVAKYDSPTTLFYFDPPYATGYRSNWGYKQLVTPQEVFKVCQGIQGKFMLSYDAVPEVRELFKDFTIIEMPTKYSLGGGSRTAEDVLIINFSPQ